MQLTQNREDKNLMGILLYYKSFLPCGIKHHWSEIEIQIEILRGMNDTENCYLYYKGFTLLGNLT